MKKQKTSAKSKPFGLFVVVAVGVILMAYVAFGLVATSVKVDRENAKMQRTKKLNALMKVAQQKQQQEEAEQVMVKDLSGEVIAIKENVVTVETNLDTDEIYRVQLMLKDEDLNLVKVGDEMTATLAKTVDAKMIEDGTQEVLNVVVKDMQQ
jgi:hypothetical protein